MRAVLQRVARASVSVEGRVVGRIDVGWLVLLGVERADSDADASWIADKILGLRAFADDQGKMNRAVAEVGGGGRDAMDPERLGDDVLNPLPRVQ